ncbi:MAG: efflux RND transporter periplasmic adaptor subunit [Deltaproteobacteria bacterium]|nr:efflux RND transporter periplasmic adaptor subunit [Deltaproteobacteria bacterium]
MGVRNPAIILSLFVLATLLAGCQASPVAPPPEIVEVSAVQVQARTIPVPLTYIGLTESSRLVEIRARVEGIIMERTFTEGKKVEKGALLFRLDPKPLETALENSRGLLAQEESKLANAKRVLQRLKSLITENAVSQKDLDEAIFSEQNYLASVKSAKAKVREAELNLGYATITAPLIGIIGRAQKPEGSLVSTGTDSLLTTISQLDPIYANFSVSAKELLKLDQEAESKRIIFPPEGKFDVELSLENGLVYPQTGQLNFAEPSVSPETGTMKFRAEFPNPDKSLVPGLFVRIKLKGAERPNAITVPQRSVLQGQKGKFVYVVDKSSKAELRLVEVGDWYDQDWIIHSGVTAGDLVVVDGAIKLQPGAALKVSAAIPAPSGSPNPKTGSK